MCKHAVKRSLRLAALCLVMLAACTFPSALPVAPDRPLSPTTAPAAGFTRLIVAPNPDGAQVTVDGVVRGSSPLTLTLAAGEHVIELRATGYAPFSETIVLEAGPEATYAPDLEDIEPPTVTLESEQSEVAWSGRTQVRAAARDNAGVVDLALALAERILMVTEGEEIVFDLVPATLTDVWPGQTYTLTATATDAAGNIGQAFLPIVIGPEQTVVASATSTPLAAATPTVSVTLSSVPATASPAAPSPSPSPRPTPSPTRPPAVTFRVTQATISTYGYRPFLRPVADPTMAGHQVLTLDRAAYEASNPKPAPVSYTLLVLENRFLRLSILPDLGGRIYEVIFKPTGNNELYRNPVIKPTGWGPPSPPYPAGANWWLAAGGIEWCFPVEEHGYDWGKEWGYNAMRLPDGGVMVSLFTGDHERPYVTVNVTLPPEAAYFTVQPTIINPTGAPARVKWWANAMLAPGSANAPGPELRFIFPVSEVTVHSTGDPSLPGPGQPLSWPIHAGRDLSRLGNWGQYLGFFERPAATGDFMGVYDLSVDEGMLRVYPSGVARGAKGFAMGWSQPIGPEAYTDDRSGYVELHGGLAPTFDDWHQLPPGGSIGWTETWYPVADIGGVTYAATTGALHLAPGQGGLRVGLFPVTPVRGEVRIALPGAETITKSADISPALPFDAVFPLPATAPAQGTVAVTLVTASGQVVFEYRGPARLR